MPEVEIHVLPGGKMPERKTDGAVGYDAFVRAIVSPSFMDPVRPRLRLTIHDFERPDEATDFFKITARRMSMENPQLSFGGGWVYRLRPGRTVCVGLGFVTRMPGRMFYWVAPRSGLASNHGITVANAPGVVDPDYRGEACAILMNNSDRPFFIHHAMRIAQVIFQEAILPEFVNVRTHDELLDTRRGTNGLGSTGL